MVKAQLVTARKVGGIQGGHGLKIQISSQDGTTWASKVVKQSKRERQNTQRRKVNLKHTWRHYHAKEGRRISVVFC